MRVQSYFPVLVLLIIIGLALSGCLGIGPAPAPTQVSDLEYTQAAETIIAELTQSALQVTPTMIAEALLSITPTTQALPATSTLEPTEILPPTSTPIPTDTPLPTDTPTPADSPTPTFTPEPVWRIVYQDDLKSGFWLTEKQDAFRLQYSYGGYMITNRILKDIAYSVRKGALANIRAEVTGKRISGPLDGYYGVICNFVNGGNYHFLGVGPDGWYGIALKQGGQIRFLQEGYDESGAVKMADVANAIRAECARGTLTLWVNGVQLASVKDNSLTAGAVGVGVGNRDNPGAEAVFQDFILYEPEQP